MNHADTATMLTLVGEHIATGLDPLKATAFLASLREGLLHCDTLSMAWPRFAIVLLNDPQHGMAYRRPVGSYGRHAIDECSRLLQSIVDGKVVTIQERDAVIVGTRHSLASSEGVSISSNAATYAAGACCYVEHVDAACYIAACGYAAEAHAYLPSSDGGVSNPAMALAVEYAWQAATLLRVVSGEAMGSLLLGASLQ